MTDAETPWSSESFVKLDITELPSFPLSRLNAVTDATVTAELADGRTLILRNAWHVGTPERNSDEGSMQVRFEGLSGEEA